MHLGFHSPGTLGCPLAAGAWSSRSLCLPDRHSSRCVRLEPVHAAAVSAEDLSSSSRDSGSSKSSRQDVQSAKQELLSWVTGTKRGSSTTKLLRGQIQEAQVQLQA
jgi:hypothetical protein